MEKSLNEATKNIVSQLEIDERSLADIRKSRKDLEKQLQELKSQEEEEEESENEDIESKQNEENQLTPNTSSKSLSATTSTPQFIKRQSSLSRLQTRDELQSAASSSTSPSSLLRFDRGDVGKRMELYIYRYNCWEVIEVVDYEPSKGLHKCRHLDKSEQWIDLKKKQFRDIK